VKSNMKKLIAIWALFSFAFSSADQLATTDDGERVVLKKNGQWRVLNASEKEAEKRELILKKMQVLREKKARFKAETEKKLEELRNKERPDYNFPEKRVFNHPPFSEKYGSEFELREDYDKFSDRTVLSLTLPLSQVKGDLDLQFMTGWKGKDVSKEKMFSFVRLSFISQSKNWKYLKGSKRLTFLIDGNRLSMGELKHKSNTKGPGVTEYLSKSLKIPVFLKIIAAKKVETQLGITEFVLSEEQLEAIRHFASMMK